MQERIIKFLEENKDKKIALFSDMDGVIAQFEFDYDKSMLKDNDGSYFLNKIPIKTVIDFFQYLTKYDNLDFYIISACQYQHQASAKAKWLELNAPFFKADKQFFVVKDVLKYTRENKSQVKTSFIVDVVNDKNYDYVLYFEDEYLMLQKAYSHLRDKLICIHISNFLK